jgi:predicted HicB family RNase H-like nuclease
MNLMTVDGYHAGIEYDEETDPFPGVILGLSGGAEAAMAGTTVGISAGRQPPTPLR